MSRARRFTKAEIRDAAMAAAETGLRARLHPSGEIEFTSEPLKREPSDTPDMILEKWLSENKVGGRA